MDIIPAIDLKNGQCVRLVQGRDELTTVYPTDPVAVAAGWVREGAPRLHVVNLDGAFGRASGNLAVLAAIADAVDVPIQFGGGLRSIDDMEQAFRAGADRIVLGTVAMESPAVLDEANALFRGRVIVALDAVGGMVATRGWHHVSDTPVVEAAHSMKRRGVREILYTDVARDGMLSGPDYATLRALAATGLDVIASGGVAHPDHIDAIRALESPRITGVIVGRALYEGKVRLADLLSHS